MSPVTGAAPQYCVSCGQKTAHEFDRDNDYWYIMAEGLGFQANERGVALTKGLYELWEPAVHTRFGDFVKETVSEHR